MENHVSGSEKHNKSPHRSETHSMCGRVLIVEDDADAAALVDSVCVSLGIPCDIARSAAEAAPLIDHVSYDILVVGVRLPDGTGIEVKERLARIDPLARTLFVGSRVSFEDVVAAMRCGAVDFVTLPLRPAELSTRLRCAWELVQQDRKRDDKLRRLRKVCRKLKVARTDVTTQVDSLCSELVNAYQELADQIAQVTSVTEFAAVIRQELDVEELLRSTLEYFLRRFGSMNAAVYLPGAGEDFTLGAYINYDCPRGQSDDALDRLGDVVASHLLDETAVRQFRSADEITSFFGDEASWLGESHVLAFTCRDAREPLAIFVLFRSLQMPFPDEAVRTLSALSEVFARQLAHVIHVHHRHLPDTDERHGWDILRDQQQKEDDDDEQSDDRGLAA